MDGAVLDPSESALIASLVEGTVATPGSMMSLDDPNEGKDATAPVIPPGPPPPTLTDACTRNITPPVAVAGADGVREGSTNGIPLFQQISDPVPETAVTAPAPTASDLPTVVVISHALGWPLTGDQCGVGEPVCVNPDLSSNSISTHLHAPTPKTAQPTLARIPEDVEVAQPDLGVAHVDTAAGPAPSHQPEGTIVSEIVTVTGDTNDASTTEAVACPVPASEMVQPDEAQPLRTSDADGGPTLENLEEPPTPYGSAFPDADGEGDIDSDDDLAQESGVDHRADLPKSARSKGGVSVISARSAGLWQARLLMCNRQTARELKGPDAVEQFEATLFHVVATNDNAVLLTKAVAELAVDSEGGTDGGGIGATDSEGRTPLMWAAACGAVACVTFIVTATKADAAAVDNSGATALHWAAAQGHTSVVGALLDANADVGTKDESGATALHFAALSTDSSTAALLIKRGVGAGSDPAALLNSVDSAGLTAAHWSSLYGKSKPLGVLLQAKANPKMRDAAGATPAHICAGSSRASVASLKLLLKADPSVFNEEDKDGCSPLHRAAGNNAKKVILVLAKTKTIDMDAKDSAGRRPLHWACALGHIDAVKALITGGCDLAAADKAGATALHIALQNRKLECARLLLAPKKRARITANVRDGKGRTPLFWAVYSRSAPACELVARSADLVALDNDGISALHAAVAITAVDAADALLSSGLPVDTTSQDGRTPLMHAIETPGKDDMVALLLKAHASVQSVDSEGKAPLHYAAIAGNSYYVALLVDRGADPTVVDSRGETPLHYACFFGQEDAAVALVQLGAAVNVADLDGLTPLHWACMHGHVDIVRMLVEVCGAAVNAMERGEQRATPLDHALIGDPENPDFVECAKILNASGAWTALELYDYAARTIQRYLRGARSRRSTAVLKERAAVENTAAAVIQAHFRGFCQRQQYRRLLREDAASRVITRAMRKTSDARRRSSATTIQRVFRGHRVRLKHGPVVEEARQAGLDKLLAERDRVRIESFKGTPEYAEMVRRAEMVERQKAWSRRAKKAQKEKMLAAKDVERRRAERVRLDKAAAAAQKATLRRSTSTRLLKEATLKTGEDMAARAHTERARRHIARIQLANARHVESSTLQRRQAQTEKLGSLWDRTFVKIRTQMALVADADGAGGDQQSQPPSAGTRASQTLPTLNAPRPRPPLQSRLKVLAEPSTRRLAEVHHLLAGPRRTRMEVGTNTARPSCTQFLPAAQRRTSLHSTV